ncbi:type I-E CRISPR-associated protein Cse1/CasA [Streptomyces sp. M2CJ-2]|uniref:type I-E CRISPR-associated protein Cse1/CasA n=1 Tax=Streptomyces sp. M2CJ-2 TaxID=2803948 RepID=UPI00192901B4|nr:type I-E CRISPR-associated protein Cse1/CasA [Streptomyces sp. M2CJ-2]MBL3670138.1 type I-E CRISPR-associated protein Cse1/CasA [Streptomyces sp. M2CJ-2]
MSETDSSGGDGALSFDLTARPWIPVLRRDGSQDELSLREVFEQAHDLRRVVGDLPTQEFALVRLLLAVAHDALEGPQDIDAWSELWAEESCFAPVGAYLETHRGRFDLLDAGAPFFQTAGLRTGKDEVFSLNRIVADVPNGEPFFTARMPTVERLTFAEAARWVVHTHAYDTSGIKTGVEGDERVKGGRVYPLGVGWAGNLGGVYVEGRTLRETLLLNLVAADTANLEIDDQDAPAWRREPCGPGGAERAPTGVRDLYTWQTRRLRLHFDETGVHGVVLGYGDPLPARDRQHREPMTAWRRSKPQEKKLKKTPVYLPREHAPERSAWRGIGSLVAGEVGKAQGSEAAAYLRPGILEWVARLVTEGELPRGFLVRARVVGACYGTQQSVIDEVVDDHVSMAVVLLHQQDRRYAEQAVAAVADADLAVNALGDLATNLARAAGTESDGPRSTARDLAYGLLEAPYRTWLARLADTDDPYVQRTAWQQQVYKIVGGLGDRLMAAAGDAAWQGRTVQLKHGTEWLNSALAGKWFRAALHKGLGRPDSTDTPPDADTASAPETTAKAPA